MICLAVNQRIPSGRKLCTAFMAVFTAYTALSYAQSRTKILPRGDDSGIVIPAATEKIGYTDASAVAEVTANTKATNAIGWKSMQGVGTIRYGTSDALPATLSNAVGRRFRLDVQAGTGVESTRITGRIGEYQSTDQRIVTLNSDATAVGIFPFHVPFEASTANQRLSVTDRGLHLVGQSMLHRISIDFPGIGIDSATGKPNTTAIDFYFDPASHLLVKTVTYSPAIGNARARFVTIVTYADYRRVGSALVPFRFTETVDGEVSRTLQLSTVQLDPTLDSSYFEF